MGDVVGLHGAAPGVRNALKGVSAIADKNGAVACFALCVAPDGAYHVNYFAEEGITRLALLGAIARELHALIAKIESE